MSWSVGVKDFSLELKRIFNRNYDNRVSCFVCVLYLFMHTHLGFKTIVELISFMFYLGCDGFFILNFVVKQFC